MTSASRVSSLDGAARDPEPRAPGAAVALLGASGFVGRHVAAALEARGAVVVRLPSLRVPGGGDAESAAAAFLQTGTFQDLARRMEGCSAAVNAAGLALPGSADAVLLGLANTAVPLVLRAAARQAGVPRFVHVSSAAAQGRRDPLDETPEVAPLTPYGRSKAFAEQALSRLSGGPDLVIYRATSVQGAGRGMTKMLARLAAFPAVPVPRDADRHLPLALAENCGAAIAHLAVESGVAPGIYLHPWEGVTLRSFLSALGVRPLAVPLLGPGFRAAAPLASMLLASSPRMTALLRNAELFFLGQGQDARGLARTGFSVPVGLEGYRALAGGGHHD
jgi:dTDP-4-dehydrorhamnose reductase